MFTRILTAAGLTLALTQGPSVAAEIALVGKDKAAGSCLAINGYAPAELVASVEDGLGDWLVWVKDKDGDIWMCNANSHGAVFANVLMQGDLLAGAGADLVGLRNVAEGSADGADAAQVAEKLCATVGNYMEDMQIVVSTQDGVGDYLVWLKNAEEKMWVCNASAEAKLYGFEPVDMPLNDVEPVVSRAA